MKTPEREADEELTVDSRRQREGENAAGGFKFQLLVDREARWSELEFWSRLAVGHAWIRLIEPTGSYDSWGFWPQDKAQVSLRAPWRSVPGSVHHPDEAHAPNAIHSYDIDAEAAERLEKEAESKTAAPPMYNLFSYNCVNFALDMAQVAGVAAPSASTLGVANPNDLFADIEKLNADRGLDPMGQRVENAE